MKPSATTQRITLFPFLAVLICTMGALLVLLVVISKRAQTTAEVAHQGITEDAKAAAEAQRITLTEDSQKLHELRNRITDHLAERRRALAHIEDHMRRLGEKIRQVQAISVDIDEDPKSRQENLDTLKAELADLAAAKKEVQQLLEELRATAPKKPSYRIVPYHGSNGTIRRPIYLECREDGVHFQPEGIHITQKDFARPLGPENPLAAGIRAQSAYLREHRSSLASRVDPYPLLIVRPSGIPAYYAARIAIRSWEAEFGYELVDEDISLDFQAPDPTLARVTQEAINIARPRHQFMVARAERLQLQTSRQRKNGNGHGHHDRRVDTGKGDDGNGFGGGGGGYRSNKSEWQANQRHGTDSDRNRSGLRRAEAARNASAQTSGNASAQTSGNASAQAAGNASAQTSGNASAQAAGNATAQAAGNATTEATEPTLDQNQASDNTQNHPPGAATLGTGASSNATNMEDQPNGVSFQFGGSQGNSQESEPPISEVRGDNWALPGASGGSFPFERPMRIEITKTEIALFHTDPRQQPIHILFENNTRQTIEQFVAAIWEHMATWGTAGRGMYWKPVLNIYTDQGAEDRANELEHLLKRSGLEIKRM